MDEAAGLALGHEDNTATTRFHAPKNCGPLSINAIIAKKGARVKPEQYVRAFPPGRESGGSEHAGHIVDEFSHVPQGFADVLFQALFAVHGLAAHGTGDAAHGHAHADALHESHYTFCHDSKHSFQLQDWFPLF